MKLAGFFAVALAVGTAHAQQVVITGSGGYAADSPYNRLYDRSRQVVFTGKVTGKVKAPPMPRMSEAMSILVKTPRNGSVQVDVGPTWFVAAQVAKINVGQTVRVIGSRARIGDQSEVLARQIVNTKNNRVLALRDLRGVPYWSARTTVAQVPRNAIGGTILNSGFVTVDGAEMVSYVIQTPNGNVNVVTAPNWFMQRQDMVFSPGAYIHVVGVQHPIQLGGNVTLANTVYTGNNTLILRNDGGPVWLGWGG